MNRDANSARALWGWALFDWANSPFTTLIITFVFSTYFARSIVGDESTGQSLWGYTNAISGLVIAIGSPVVGAIADVGGRRKPWIAVFTAVCALGSAALWFATPETDSIPLAMTCVVIATVGFEFGIVFNNAMLPDLVAEPRLGRWSGWAWGLGYAGGLLALVIALFAFVQKDTPLFGLDNGAEAQEHVRVVGPLVGAWFVVFVWPFFLFTPDRPSTRLPTRRAVKLGLGAVWTTLRQLHRYGNVARFLVARMFYADGLATVFAIGGTYAAGVFGMSFSQVIMFGLLLNVTAGLGATVFAWLDDRVGSKTTIIVSLIGLAGSSLAALLSTQVTAFWIAGAALGLFVGPAQSASRSMMARIAPNENMTEFFGLYAFTGKATAFLGPALVGVVTGATNNQRFGMAVVFGFFILGGLLLWGVREERTAAHSIDGSALGG